MNRSTLLPILLYGLCLGALTALMYWARYRLLVFETRFEVYVLLIALIFVGLGAWLGIRLTKPKTVIRHEIVFRDVPVPVVMEIPQRPKVTERVQESALISQRELDVLRALAKGLSNEEIAAELYVSANTVKTHLSNLYFKLDVKRRTQAVERARQLGLLD